jgi:hypothetical protein
MPLPLLQFQVDTQNKVEAAKIKFLADALYISHTASHSTEQLQHPNSVT